MRDAQFHLLMKEKTMFRDRKFWIGSALPVTLAVAAIPVQTLAADQPSNSIEVEAQTQDFNKGFGSVNTLRLDYKFEDDNTTVTVSPEAGERRAAGQSRSALGIGATFYLDVTQTLTTQTSVAIAEDEPVFAQYDLAQDVTFKLVPQTTGTVGVRWARYFGNRDVYFANAGFRYYFSGGSVAYRLSYVDPDNRGDFLAHLVNLSLKDAEGDGMTQLWLSAGSSSIDRTPLDEEFSGEDYGAFLRRVQPISGPIDLIAGAGFTSYDRPDDRITAWKFALGFGYDFGR
jgi:YaiO family outer membrane protein